MGSGMVTGLTGSEGEESSVPEWKQAWRIVGAKYVNFLHAAFDIIFRVFATFGQSTGGVRQTADNGRTSGVPKGTASQTI